VYRLVIVGLIVLLCHSCIDSFTPVIDEIQEVMVIEGMISDGPGIHKLKVSRSTPYNTPSYKPVKGCVVTVQDNEGNLEFYSESIHEDGLYEAWLEEPFLEVGKAYSVQVITPSNETYASEYDTLLACPPIDSLYYVERIFSGEKPDDTWNGIQFFNDVRGHQGGARNFRWKGIATWEYHSPYTAEYIRHREETIPYLKDSVSTCYLTETIARVYVASTNMLSENTIFQNKLHHVSNQTPRLTERYTLLVEQHSLTDQAYAYWEKLAAQSANSASLFEAQPSGSPGNIYNVNSSHEKVLGCFYATQIQEERIVVDKTELSFSLNSYTCELDSLMDNSKFLFDEYYYVFSLSQFGPPGPPWLTAPKNCFDCTLLGGSNQIPDFW